MQINTLQGINISYLGKRKIIFKSAFLWDMLVPWRVYHTWILWVPEWNPPIFNSIPTCLIKVSCINQLFDLRRHWNESSCPPEKHSSPWESFPRDPWDWYIYLHLADFYGFHVGKIYQSHGSYGIGPSKQKIVWQGLTLYFAGGCGE